MERGKGGIQRKSKERERQKEGNRERERGLRKNERNRVESEITR